MKNYSQLRNLKLILVLCTLISAGSACRIKSKTNEPADMKKLEERIPGVHKVSFNGIPKVEIVKGTEAIVEIAGSPEDLDRLDMTTVDGVYTIKYNGAANEENNSIMAKLTLKGLELLKGNAVGDLRIEDVMDPDHSEVNLSGVGQVNLRLNSKQIKCTVSSAAMVKISGQVKDGEINLTAIASLDLDEFDTGNAKLQKVAIARQ